MVVVTTKETGYLSPDHPRNITGRGFNLLTPEQIQSLPAGTEVYTYHGLKAIVGVDEMNLDARAGFTAYGFYADRAGQTFYVLKPAYNPR
jgi:hypothetical protein